MNFVIYQPDRPIRLAEIHEGNLSIGRASGNDVVINDPKVSRNHARIVCSDGRSFLEDLGSRAGTLLNGKPIDGHSRISPGDELLIGETRISIEGAKNSEETAYFQGTAQRKRISGSMEINAESQEATGEHISTKYLTTNISEKMLTPPFHRLVQIENGTMGRHYPLEQSELCIGRSQKCDIKLIKDRAVSSFHACLTLEKNRYWIKDFNSRNGTMINGTRAKKPVEIHHGDQIRIGETEFIYNNQETPISEEAYKHFLNHRRLRRPRRLFLFALLLVIGVSVMVGQSFWSDHLKAAGILTLASGHKETKGFQAENSVMSELSDRHSTEIDMASAGQFEASHLWQEAAEIYKKVLQEAPRLSSAIDGLNRCRLEIKHQARFEKGLSLYEQGNWAESVSKLKEIPVESVYSARALQKIGLASDKIEETKAKKVAQKKATKAIVPDAEAQSHVASALEHYAAGYFEPALNALQQGFKKTYVHDGKMKKKLQQTQEAIRNIEQMTERGRELYYAGNVDEAFGKWEEALRLDRVLVGIAPSASAEKIGLYVAEEFCRRAKIHFEAENDEEAMKQVELAEKASPGHQGARKIRALVETRHRKVIAQRRFEEAEQIKDIDLSAAIRKWEEIVVSTGEDNKYHQKSKGMLAKYRNGGRLLPDAWE